MGFTLAVWGGPGSGKTAFSVKLSQHLLEQGQTVLLLLADRVAPPLPTLAGRSRLSNQRSLGSVLAVPQPSPALVRFHQISVEGQPELGVLGLLKSENPRSYPEPGREQVRQLLEVLRQMADAVIIDCGSTLAWDVLSLTAVEQADVSLCMMTPELKTVNYLSSQLSLIEARDNQYQYRILNHTGEEIAVRAEAFAEADHSLPYCQELAEQGAMGELLEPLASKTSRRYNQALSAFAAEILTENKEVKTYNEA